MLDRCLRQGNTEAKGRGDDGMNNDSMWLVDYGCPECGQRGTARFIGEDMTTDSDGNAVPSNEVYCCVCKSSVDIEDIECTDDGDGNKELVAFLNKAKGDSNVSK